MLDSVTIGVFSGGLQSLTISFYLVHWQPKPRT